MMFNTTDNTLVFINTLGFSLLNEQKKRGDLSFDNGKVREEERRKKKTIENLKNKKQREE